VLKWVRAELEGDYREATVVSLRIGWASPWNIRSAIARSGASVVCELTDRGHAVDIIRTETGGYLDLEPRPAPNAIRHLCDVDPRNLCREYDAVVVNLADHRGLHGAAVHALPHLGAIVILHDPLLEWFAGVAIGAIVHAEHYADAVRRACPGPVATVPLAYPDPGFRPPRPIGDDVTVLTLGHANRNECADRVIMAIASSRELRLRCRYRLVGPYEESERCRLLALARHAGVAPPEFIGWVQESDLRSEVEAADVICCLRNPMSGGGSASAIFGMLSGRPLLVSGHGDYEEIPDDLVFKCRPGDETTEVALHISTILRDTAAAQAKGAAACDYARKHHSPRSYVDTLLPFLDRAISVGPAITTSIALGRMLASFGVKPDDPAADRAVGALVSLIE
jgi:glycosyltransferase involved in cell wall biosynthesis